MVIADAVTARTFVAEPDAQGRVRLVERASLKNRDYPAPSAGAALAQTAPSRVAADSPPPSEARSRQRMEIERRFAAEIAQRIGSTVKGWTSGSVVLAAEPGMLGLIRELAQEALPPGLTLKSLARDYVRLSADELAQRLDLS
ncbi:MAG: host attachment protein [Burkholderiales bacterium]